MEDYNMRNTDDFKERFKRWKNGENYWAIRADRDQYDYNRAAELGYGPDGTGHWPSRDNQTGRILKSATHPTIIKSAAEDAVGGYRWNVDKNGDVYSTTWDELEKRRIPTIETPYLPHYSGGKPKRQYVYDVLPGLFAKDGVKITVSSGYRPGAVVADTGKPSRHGAHQAADIVGDFAQIRKVLDNPNSNVSKWMVANGYGYIDETAKTGTTKHWSPRRRHEYELGLSDNSHYHIGEDSYYAEQYAAQMNKLLAQAAQTRPSVTYAMQPIVQPEPPAIPVTTKSVDTNKIYGPVELPNVNVVGDIRAAIQKMDEEKRNRALDEITRFGPLPNPIAFFNSFWGEDLPTRQTLNKPIWTVQ